MYKCICGAEIKIRTYYGKRVKRYLPKYCSRECFYKHRERPSGLKYNIVVENKAWFKNKGGTIDEKGYVRISVGGGKYQRKHRHVVEQYIGRKLKMNEVVHHVNGDKKDNRIENLQVMTKDEHDNLHRGKSICLTK